jgi:MATE family multidrug resistance protein
LSEGLSLTRPSMYFSLGGLVLLVPLGYVLMFGKLGLPPQGAHGCGIATATVLWLEMLAFGIYVLAIATIAAWVCSIISNGRICGASLR